MKIALFNPYNIFLPGGVQDHVRAQVDELRKRGHQVTILTPRPRKYTDTIPRDVEFIGVSARVRAQSSTVDISAPTDQEEIDALFRNNIYDVVHFHEPIVPFIGRQLIASCPYPVVATLHAALPDTGIGRTLGSITPYFRSVLQHVDVFTRVSSAAGVYLGELLDGVEMFEVPNGVTLTEVDKPKKREQATIVFVGRLEKRKGPKYLLKAFARLQERIPEAKLVMIGDGPEKEKLRELVDENDIKNVTFTGYVSDEKKQHYLLHSTVASFPALYGESFGIVLLEAMASGIPIVAGANPGYASVLTGKGLLSLVDPKDEEEYARRLEVFIKDAELREMMISWGFSHVRTFSYDNIVNEYEKIYDYAIKKHAKA